MDNAQLGPCGRVSAQAQRPAASASAFFCSSVLVGVDDGDCEPDGVPLGVTLGLEVEVVPPLPGLTASESNSGVSCRSRRIKRQSCPASGFHSTRLTSSGHGCQGTV